MLYNPNTQHRRSVRLKDYDYSKEGVYFITICTHGRECLFGNISNDKMLLNDFGKIADECWLEIPQHFPNVQLHEHVVMPNHIHGIIQITENNVGAENILPNQESRIERTEDVLSQIQRAENFLPLRQDYQPHAFQKMTPQSVAAIVKGFKIGVTKWFRQNTDIHVVWQRNYHEHIIRNRNSYQMISDYIINNPAKWIDDKFYVA